MPPGGKLAKNGFRASLVQMFCVSNPGSAAVNGNFAFRTKHNKQKLISVVLSQPPVSIRVQVGAAYCSSISSCTVFLS